MNVHDFNDDDAPPPMNRLLFAILCALGATGIFGLVWVMTGPAKASEPRAWLVPTLVLVSGQHVTGAPGWHPRQYPTLNACRTQMALARSMTPPAGAQEVLWQCLQFNPLEGRPA